MGSGLASIGIRLDLLLFLFDEECLDAVAGDNDCHHERFAEQATEQSLPNGNIPAPDNPGRFTGVAQADF